MFALTLFDEQTTVVMPVNMDKQDSDESRYLSPSSAAASLGQASLATTNHIPASSVASFPSSNSRSLLESFHTNLGNSSRAFESPAGSTPEIANDISGRLNLGSTTTEDDETDSAMEDDSSSSEQDDRLLLGLPITSLPTGLCYDERMRYHAEVQSSIESNGLHPEDPRRIYYIFKMLCNAGLVGDLPGQKPIVNQPLHRINAREATQEECCLVHSPGHWEFVKSTEGDNSSAWSIL